MIFKIFVKALIKSNFSTHLFNPSSRANLVCDTKIQLHSFVISVTDTVTHFTIWPQYGILDKLASNFYKMET